MYNGHVFTQNLGSKKNSSIPSLFPEYVDYANAYVPFQQNTKMFDLRASLCNGTVFTALYQPYKEGRCGCE